MARILTVCTGNICRSPIAEMLLEQQFAGAAVQFESAGTHALVGTAMPKQAQALASQLGIDVERSGAHEGQLLTAEMIDDADVILTMSRAQRKFIVENWPEARRKSFTIREFARLATGVTPGERARLRTEFSNADERVTAAIDHVASKRGRVAPPESPDDDDVIDPYRRPRWIYRRSGKQLGPAVTETASFLRAVLD